MEKQIVSPWICCAFLFFCLFLYPVQAQQAYEGQGGLNCSDDSSITKGYLCNGPPKSCNAYVAFRAHPPYNNPFSISDLLGSDAMEINRINDASLTGQIPTNKLVVAPVSCSCFGEYYQQNSLYTIKFPKNDTYYNLAMDTFQGLTTCKALLSQNSYDPLNLTIGTVVLVPLRCACLSEQQARDGFSFLLTYPVAPNDTILSIAQVFGVEVRSIVETNRLNDTGKIYPVSTLLIPMKSESCTGQPGNSFCFCANGFLRSGRNGRVCKPGSRGHSIRWVVLIGVAVGCVLLCFVLSCYWLFRCLKKRKNSKRKARLFKQNGGFLLHRQLATTSGGAQKTKIFNAEELEQATDNYSQARVLGRGGFGTVYKGMLLDGSIVAVKKAKAVDKNEIDQFINEVVVLSQINHRNVVDLLGCCLETEVPLLVYEYVPNGSLADHIHMPGSQTESLLSWSDRVRVASEVAGALAYMHSAASIPIFHRDIKSSNVLLDEKYTAKVSDFGISRSVPIDQTHLTTKVRGTFGYLDPEYFLTSQYTEKSDVYSFGVVLVELITGQKPISFARADNQVNLVDYFMSAMEEEQLSQVLDQGVAEEGRMEEVVMVAKLAKRCLNARGKERPAMKEVAIELDNMRKKLKFSGIGQEIQPLKDEVSSVRVDQNEQEIMLDDLAIDSSSINSSY